jgi:protein-S-isoprenylcysteine O-methyltransferase Ste14
MSEADDEMTLAARLPLLARMRGELLDQGSLQPTTVVAMYVAYGVHAAATAVSLRSRWLELPAPRRAARLSGAVLAAGGTGLCVLGMRRFAGPGQVGGTRAGPVETGGVYRYSRNPQYLGYVAALTGVAVARRSGASLILAAAAGAIYAVWVPVEEEHLTGTFGESYRRYRRGTARWLGRPPAAR